MAQMHAPPPAYNFQQQAANSPPVQSSTQAVTVVTVPPPTVTMQNVIFRDFPITMTDSNGQRFTTLLEYRIGLLIWVVVGVIFLITLWFGLCFFAIIPFFINDLKDVYHLNPYTREVVGVYRRMN